MSVDFRETLLGRLPNAVFAEGPKFLAQFPDEFGSNPRELPWGELTIYPEVGDGLEFGNNGVQRLAVAHGDETSHPWKILANYIVSDDGGLIHEISAEQVHPRALIFGIVFGGIIRSAQATIARGARMYGGELDGVSGLFDNATIDDFAKLLNSRIYNTASAKHQVTLIRTLMRDAARLEGDVVAVDSELSQFARATGNVVIRNSLVTDFASLSNTFKFVDSTASGNTILRGAGTSLRSDFGEDSIAEGAPFATDSMVRGSARLLQEAQILRVRMDDDTQATGRSIGIDLEMTGDAQLHDDSRAEDANLHNVKVYGNASIAHTDAEEVTSAELYDWAQVDALNAKNDTTYLGGIEARRSHMARNVLLEDRVLIQGSRIADIRGAGHATVTNSNVEASTFDGYAVITDSDLKRVTIGDHAVVDETSADGGIVIGYATVSGSRLEVKPVLRGASETRDSMLVGEPIVTGLAKLDNVFVDKKSVIDDYAQVSPPSVTNDSNVGGAVKLRGCRVISSELLGTVKLENLEIKSKRVIHACKDDNWGKKVLGSNFDPNHFFTCSGCHKPAYWAQNFVMAPRNS